MEVPAEDVTCAICFEEVSTQMTLPCTCNVVYCAQCWDRSLAQSFNAYGQARCPTCRGPICVDFDPEEVCLVFSRASAPLSTDLEGLGVHDARTVKEQSKNDAVQKLRQQALPAQVRLLQKHGWRHPGLKEMASAPEVELRRMPVSELSQHMATLGGSSVDSSSPQGTDCEKEELVRCLAQKKEVMCRVLGERLASLTEELPACVCGSSLIRVSGEERTMRCCDKMAMLSGFARDSNNYRMVFERLTVLQRSICFCDLCGESVPTANSVWTCKNGDTTILHATSYDVCDECFMKYAVLGEIMPSSSPRVVDTEMTAA